MPSPHRLATLALAALLALPAARGAVPAAAGDFALPARDGGTVRLSELRGQVVMINFCATWCGPCRQEMPLLEQLHAKYEPLGFTLLGVNVEPDSTQAQDWLKRVPVTFPIVFDRDNTVSAAGLLLCELRGLLRCMGFLELARCGGALAY